jgi:MoxR-like ATPase
MDTTTAFTTDEKWLLVRIVLPNTPRGAGPVDRPFKKALQLLFRQYHRLGTVSARDRFLSGARQALNLGTVRRTSWAEASQLLVLYAKLLHVFGWGGRELTAAIHAATQTAGNEEAKNNALFSSILSLPFGIIQQPCRDLDQISAALDAALFGLKGVKDEIRNQLVLRAHAPGMPRSAPLLLVGPPGTGKTAVAQAIAAALGLPFFTAALGGNCDTIFLRGSHYSWASATPGFFAKTLMSAGCLNPVVLLDELDKAGGYAHGDLSDTLTEVFDVNQAHKYRDLFLMDIPIDLSKVLWVATANDLNKMPPYIVNRCKVIKVPAYGLAERKIIIQQYFPAQLRQQLDVAFGIEVSDSVAAQVATATDSLREAKQLLIDLVARELLSKAPGTVKRLTLSTWDPSLARPATHERPRRIGFAAPEVASNETSM